MVDGAAGELVLGPTVLGEQGKENVNLGLSEMDNFSSSFFSKEFEIELGSGTKCFDSGRRSGWGWRADNVGVWVDGGGFKGVQVNKGNASVSKQGGVLGGVDII